RLRKRGVALLTLAVVAGLYGAIRVGEISAKRIMHPAPTALDLADARARAANPQWWTAEPAPAPQPLATASLPDTTTTPAPVQRTLVVSPGDTLMDLLRRAGVTSADAQDAIDAIRAVFDPRSIRPGNALTVTFGPDDSDSATPPKLIKVSLPLDSTRTVEVRRDATDGFDASNVAQPLAHELVRAQGTIRSSLYEDGIAAGIPAPILSEMIRAFSYDVDFQREIKPGDRFEAAFTRYVDGQGRVAKSGPLVYASLVLAGRRLSVYRFQPKGGVADYFNAKGESVRKALLRTPIDGARITSGYGMRLHPILGYTVMHKGVDFGAPTGTPIMAAGAGVVQMAGLSGNYGIYIRVKHNSEYSTAYAHMSRIAAGIHVGTRVRQGEVIGYVGQTGLATGPHLYYEVLVDGKQINPLSVRLPTGVKLAGTELKTFDRDKIEVDRELASLPSAATKTARANF
ncbi:MAG TPA: M23 family metallopeptidase, partial [Alphaproteobacteria bacterium]|nr:M23 family metallopeptidase [Alphaproteobacteria bacterium]